MSTCIVIEDGRSWWAANWAYDAVVRSIAAALPEEALAQALGIWLGEQTCEKLGPGLGEVDLRELSPSARTLFRAAARRAFATTKAGPPPTWGDPSFFGPWAERFEVLIRLLDSVDCGEDPALFNPHATRLVDPTGKKVGPGW